MLKPDALDAYNQRYHALSLAVSLQLPYKTAQDVLKTAETLRQYLTGEKK